MEQTAKPQVMNFNPEIENTYLEKVKVGVDRFKTEGGTTVLFDWDGTIRGNYLAKGVSNYIRSGFQAAYEYCKAQGLRVGICSQRLVNDIEDLTHLGITFDEINGADSMLTYIENHPSKYHKAAGLILTKDEVEIKQMAQPFFSEIQAGKRPEGWEAFLQASGETQANNPNGKSYKNLFMAYRLSEGELLFLVDNAAPGQIAELFGMGVKIPEAEGYEHDYQ